MDQIKNSDRPVSGSALAKTFQVSRQVIVQDIALIRAEGNNVISTNRGISINAITISFLSLIFILFLIT